MEFLDRIAILIPLPRQHRHRYHGVLAPNAPLRELVTGRAGQPVDAEIAVCGDETKSAEIEEQTSGSLFVSIWAMLLARIFEINPLVCPRCGGGRFIAPAKPALPPSMVVEMQIIAFITEMEPIGRVLQHIGEPVSAPEISPARGPPNLDLELGQSQEWDVDTANQGPEFTYDQTSNW